MQVEVITNPKIETLATALRANLIECSNFNIASAFVSKQSVELLNIFLVKNKSQYPLGRILISLFNSFNSKEVLEDLKKLSKKSGLQIHISQNRRFHWKYYHFAEKNTNFIYTGSANFTEDGLSEPGEIMTRLTLTTKEKAIVSKYKTAFNEEWENSVSIIDVPLEHYKQNKASSTNRELPADIAAVLTKKQKPRPSFELKAITIVSKGLKAATIKLVNQNQPLWQKNNWDYFSSFYKREYEISNVAFILLIDKKAGKYSFEVIERLDGCDCKTPDGNYFTAFKNRGKSIAETPVIRKQIESLGLLYHSRDFLPKRLNKKQAECILKILKYRT